MSSVSQLPAILLFFLSFLFGTAMLIISNIIVVIAEGNLH
jgi:hypothetical protein